MYNVGFGLAGVLMILGASFEFETNHNQEVVTRRSDNEEIPMVGWGSKPTVTIDLIKYLLLKPDKLIIVAFFVGYLFAWEFHLLPFYDILE